MFIHCLAIYEAKIVIESKVQTSSESEFMQQN